MESVSSELNQNFIGLAKIDLHHLAFHNELNVTDNAHVKRLANVFDEELDRDDCIHAIIDGAVLDQALRESGVASLEQLHSNQAIHLKLPARTKIACLDGEHRILAAKKSLHAGQRWWTPLKGADLSEAAKTYIRETYKFERVRSDGEVYRQIQYYRQKNDSRSVSRWIKRLSRSKEKKSMQRLLKKDSQWLLMGLNSLLEYDSLWDDFLLGPIPTILSGKCIEEVSRYLETMRYGWSKITGNDRDIISSINIDTIRKLQRLAPSLCNDDHASVISLLQRGEIFPKLSALKRSSVQERLLSFKGMILSFRTFFEDVKMLEAPKIGLRQLFPPKTSWKYYRGSLRDTVHEYYGAAPEPEGRCYVEYGFGSDGYEDEPKNFDYRYQQLCLRCIRNSTEITGVEPKKGKKVTRNQMQIIPEGSQGSAWIGLANLAFRSGFSSPEVESLKQGDPDEIETRYQLLRQRPTSLYNVSQEDLDIIVRRRLDDLARFEKIRTDFRSPDISVDIGGLPIKERCAMPSKTFHLKDKEFLYLSFIHSNVPEPSKKAMLSSYATRALIFVAFFGYVVNANSGTPKAGPVPLEVVIPMEPANQPASQSEQPANQSEQPANQFEQPANQFEQPANQFEHPANQLKRPVLVDNTASSLIKAITETEDKVIFYNFSHSTWIHVTNEAEALQSGAARIANGYFNHGNIGKQRFAYVKNNKLRYISPEQIFNVVNGADADFPRLVLCMNENVDLNNISKNFDEYLSQFRSLKRGSGNFRGLTASSHSKIARPR